MLLSECIDKYINENAQYLKERTLFTYNERKKIYIETFGDVDIDTITQEMLQNQINELRTVVARLTQYIQDKIENPNTNPLYKVVDSFGKVTYFYDKKSLLESLDISSQELTKHLNGNSTVLDDLGILVVCLK